MKGKLNALLAIVTFVGLVLFGAPLISVQTTTAAASHIHIDKDMTVNVDQGYSCSGDVLVDGKRLYDNDGNTHLVVQMDVKGAVTAPFQADCYNSMSGSTLAAKNNATLIKWNGPNTAPQPGTPQDTQPQQPPPPQAAPQPQAPQPQSTPVISSAPYTFPNGISISGPWRIFYETHGGLATIGLPLSTVMDRTDKLDGKPYQVQYFERQIMERHPEFAGTINEIEGVQLGTQAFHDEVGNGKCEEHTLVKGEEYTVAAGCSVKGEVLIFSDGQWLKLFDNNPNTGFLVTFSAPTQIRADFGGNVSPRSACNLLDELETKGCNGGCVSVNHVLWPAARGK